MKRLLILALLLAACAPQALQAPLATPTQSIQSMINSAAVGSVVTIPPGIYNENVNVNKNITLQASGSVIIDGTGLPVQSGGGLINIPANVVATVKGFEVRNGGTYGISVFSNNSTIANNVIHDIKGAGIWMRDGKNNIFDGNEIYKTVQDNASGSSCSPTSTGWASAINSWGAASNNVWRNNNVHDNCGEGMVVYAGDLVENNTFKDNWSVEIYIVDGYATVRNNTIVDTKPYTARGSDQSWRAVPSAISIGDESVCRVTDNSITGNSITGSRYGISFYAFPATASCTGIKNTTISGNTIKDVKEYGFRILTGQHANSSIVNNSVTLTASTARPMTIQSGAFVITGNVFQSVNTVFEFNGKSYSNFTTWSAVVPGNFWGSGAIVTPVPATVTPSATSTPTLTSTASVVPTWTATKTMTATFPPATIVTDTSIPSKTATITPTDVPLSLVCMDVPLTMTVNGTPQSKICFMP